jgi:repressor LexA
VEVKEIIKKRRLEMKLTQDQLADMIGVSSSTVTRYETGEIVNIRRDKIEKLADALKIPPSELVKASVSSLYSNPNMIPVKELKMIPIFGPIRAGTPSLADNQIIGYEPFAVENPEKHFFLKVSGDSMIGSRICDGDLVLIEKQPEARDGEIVAVLIDGQDATLKQIKYTPTAIIFIAHNPTYDPIVIPIEQIKEDPEYIRILGVVTSLVVKFR